jgi:uncharacterized protein YggE
MRRITVTGKGKLQVKPELTEVKLIIKGLEDEYYQALAKSVDETNVVKMILINNGLPKESLKTQTFDVYKKTKQVKDQYGNYHDKFLGYEYDHVITFKFENNNELLGKLLFEISKLKVNPEVRVKYLIKDFEKAKNDLLADAVKDSMTKAKIMADASNVELGEIESLVYSWTSIRYETNDFRVMNKCSMDLCAVEATSFDIDIEPDDIDLTDTVTVVWNIK